MNSYLPKKQSHIRSPLKNMPVPVEKITGVVLAGGQGRRLGGMDKGLSLWRGTPLIKHVLDALKPQVSDLLINANRNADYYAEFGYPVIPDELPDYQGPLAGIAKAMDTATTDYLVITPCDCPHIATDLVSRLYNASIKKQCSLCVAHDGKRLQPLFALLDLKLRESLHEYLRQDGRKPDQWYSRQGFYAVDFSDQPNVFSNLNTISDFADPVDNTDQR